MASFNPAINPPRLPSPTKKGHHSRTPSHSPARRYRAVRHQDALLRDLSPTKTLHAFASRSDEAKTNDGIKSIENVSNAERALGTKAAQSCLDMRSWVREIDAWDWPGSFDVPEPARKKQRLNGSSHEGEEDIHEHWGSLPSQTVQYYQQRVDRISEDLEQIDVEELKDVVLSAHSRAGYGQVSTDDSVGVIAADTDLKHLDDFTALVTATILQTLPYLSRLNRLLDTWSLRLSILRGAPGFLNDLVRARSDLDHGWTLLAVPNAATAADVNDATFSRDTMMETKVTVEKKVSNLGRRLDDFLNMLEGQQECVPDAWIEDFEDLEQQYGSWVVQAERKVVAQEWLLSTNAVIETENSGIVKDADGEVVQSDDPEVHDLSQDDQMNDSTPADITSTTSDRAAYTTVDTSTHTTPSGPQTTVVTTTRPLSSTMTQTSIETSTRSAHRLSDAPTTSSTTSSIRRQRHVPIIVEGFADGSGSRDLTETPSADSSVASTPRRPSWKSANTTDTTKANVKQRAAFLNGDIEKSDRLNKSKPAPIVRPFEHASNAFTRLFKRDKENEAASASKSTTTAPKGRTSKRNDLSTTAMENLYPRPNQRAKMGYADLFSVPTSTSPEDAGRPSYNRDGRPRTAKKVDPRVLEYVDMVQAPERRSLDRSRSYSQPRISRENTSSTTGKGSRTRSSSTRSKRSSRQSNTALVPRDGTEPVLYPTVSEEEGPETYLPTGLSSPFHSPIEESAPTFEMPVNWPLSNDPTPDNETEDPMTRATQIGPVQPSSASAGGVISTDAFEDMFVAGIESTPHVPVQSNVRTPDEKHTRLGELTAFASTTPSRRIATDDGYFYQERPSPDRSLLLTGRSADSVRLDGRSATAMPRPVSMVMEANEDGTAEHYGYVEKGKSKAEDSGVNHFGFSGEPSSATPTSHSRKTSLSAIQRSMSDPPVSPAVLRLRIPSSDSAERDPDDEQEARGDIIRRASATSIETYPRSRVRSIDVVRPQSVVDSPHAGPHPLHEVSSPIRETANATTVASDEPSPLQYKGAYFPSPPASPPAIPPRSSSRRSSLDIRRSIDKGRPLDANDLNSRIKKSRQKQVASPAKNEMPLRKGEDNFDRHVSEVLDRVHADNIKFRTRPGAGTPLPQQKQAKHVERSNQNMTLAPAEATPRKTTTADPDVKLYHLMQAGRSEPIKLYVRLVGEGERVMVRVGGGWADLAEYLRQYAEHHGSRTASEGGVELQTATTANGHGKRTFSGSTAAEPKVRGAPVTPLSGLPLSGPLDDYDDAPIPSPLFSGRSLDKGYKTPNSSRPSTAHTTSPDTLQVPGLRPSSRQAESVGSSPPANLSMGGSASSNKTKADLPEQKARWVEGMIERVSKSASAEKRQAFADMGRAGSTRRVVMRKSSAGPAG